MKVIVCAVASLVVFGALAEGPLAGQRKNLTPEERAAAKERALKKSGGVIFRKGTGKVVVVDCQSKVPKEKIDAKVKEFHKFLFVDMERVEGGSVRAADILKVCRGKPAGAAAALYIVDDPDLPMSLMCAEEQWAMINVAHLQGDDRFEKQFARGAIMAFGGGVSQYKGSPMQTVRKPDDLDRIVSRTMGMDNLMGVRRNFEELGVKPPVRSTYKRACVEGWAPAPTNEYQKAIWDSVHAVPTNPIKIEFDPKKDK